MSKHDTNSLTKLERLAVLLRDDGVELEALDAQELDRYLQDLNVDMTDPRKRFDYLLKKAKARQRLERARARRLEGVERSKTLVRDRVREMIDKLGQRDPNQALVFAREFQKATPEDLESLEEDLTILEMESDSDDQTNQ